MDFEIISETSGSDSSESTSLEQNESKNMDESSEGEMSAEDVPRDAESEDANLHSQETHWMEENVEPSASVEELKKSVTEKNEQLKALNWQHEQVLNEVECQRVALQELEEMKNGLVEEKKRAEEEKKNSDHTLTQLQDRIRELESTVDDLKKRLTGDGVSSKSVHDKREAEWLNEKDRLLGSIEQLERTVEEGDRNLEVQEALQEKYKELETEKKELEDKYARVAEEVNVLAKKSEETDTKHAQECSALVDQRAELQNVCEELRAENEKLMAEKNRLEEEIHETTVRSQAIIQKLQSNVDDHGTRSRESQQALELLNEQLASTAQQNDLANRTTAELEAKNMEIQKELATLQQQLVKREGLYKELSEINNEMEEQISKNKKTIRELKTNLQEKTKANEQQSATVRELKKENEDLKVQMDKFVSTSREVQNEKSRLENELVEIRLNEKQLHAENASHSGKVQALRSENVKLREELDFYMNKCRDLEAGVKLNADVEISQLQSALEALNDENDVLRKRNQALTTDLRVRSNEKRMDESEKANKNHTIVGKENGGYSSDSVREEETKQKSLRPELMDTSTDEDTATPSHTNEEQWYKADWGVKLLQKIYGELNGAFGKIDMSRAVTTKDLSLVVTTDRSQKLTVNFPKVFPNGAVLVSCGKDTKQIKVPFNRNAPESEFAAEFCKKLCEYAYDER